MKPANDSAAAVSRSFFDYRSDSPKVDKDAKLRVANEMLCRSVGPLDMRLVGFIVDFYSCLKHLKMHL
jgi:hypothetical protein